MCCCETKAGQDNIISVNNNNTQQIAALFPDPGLAVANATIAALQADARHTMMNGNGSYNGGGGGGNGNGNGGSTFNCNCDGKGKLTITDVQALIAAAVEAPT